MNVGKQVVSKWVWSQWGDFPDVRATEPQRYRCLCAG